MKLSEFHGTLHKPIPWTFVYDSAKAWFYKHLVLHYFMHLTYCRLRYNWENFSFLEFRKRHLDYKIKNECIEMKTHILTEMIEPTEDLVQPEALFDL